MCAHCGGGWCELSVMRLEGERGLQTDMVSPSLSLLFLSLFPFCSTFLVLRVRRELERGHSHPHNLLRGK